MRSWLTGALALFLLTPLAQAENISWPQEIAADSGAVVLVYQPQVEEFSGNESRRTCRRFRKVARHGLTRRCSARSGSKPRSIRIAMREQQYDSERRHSRRALSRTPVTSKCRSSANSLRASLNDPVSRYPSTSCSPTSTPKRPAARRRSSSTTRQRSFWRQSRPCWSRSTANRSSQKIEGSSYERVVNTPFPPRQRW